MATYDVDEGRLPVPEGWEDRTVNTLDYPRPTGLLRVVMTRQQARGRDIRKIVDENLVDMGRRLAGFELVSREEVELDGETGVSVFVHFKDDGELRDQRSLWLVVGKKALTVGVVCDATSSAECEAIFAQIRATLRLRDDDAEEPLEAAPPIAPPSV